MMNNTGENIMQSGFAAGIGNDRGYSVEVKETDDQAATGLLFITTFPPRECGIATYSQDLVHAIQEKFGASFTINICPLLTGDEQVATARQHTYSMYPDQSAGFPRLASRINRDSAIQLIVVQHEFGLFSNCAAELTDFLQLLEKPVVLVFHTVLADPDEKLLNLVVETVNACDQLIVMTLHSAMLLQEQYGIAGDKITVIPHGTHLVPHSDKNKLKASLGLKGRKVLTTFGLLSSGKGIETTLDALPAIVAEFPDVLFLIIGKTHPSVVKAEGESYRNRLIRQVQASGLDRHVRFINYFVSLPELLNYLQLTDIYLFTSRDPLQAVSGTFAYAISCGCPVISTPIPHALEVLGRDTGIFVGFDRPDQLAAAVIALLGDDDKREAIGSDGLHRMASTAWENAAIAHARLFSCLLTGRGMLEYSLPDISLAHLRKMTTRNGLLQFSRLNKPDIESGYTLDDNARAMIAMCMHFEQTGDLADLYYIRVYLDFIQLCQQADGRFLNYVDEDMLFTPQNDVTNLDDANGRAVWALGFLVSKKSLLPDVLSTLAFDMMKRALLVMPEIHSTRAMAFILKGLYYKNKVHHEDSDIALVTLFADRMVQMYRHESDQEWHWFENYLTYANSLLPEALLCAWEVVRNNVYKEIARESFDFLLKRIFRNNHISVISNTSWLHNRTRPVQDTEPGGEQPIEVAYTILALERFYRVYQQEKYAFYIKKSFYWFLGDNHLHQIIYNPCTGGCYDGLEEGYVNLNQGAESTISYLLARLVTGRQLQTDDVRQQHYALEEALYDYNSA